MIFNYRFGKRSDPPCSDCDEEGYCTMNCGPAVPPVKRMDEKEQAKWRGEGVKPVGKVTNVVAAPYSPRERVEQVAKEFAESLVKTVINEKPGFFEVNVTVEAFGTQAALHFEIARLEVERSTFKDSKRYILEALQANWNRLPETSRFALEGQHHLFDKTDSCYWIRERDAKERLNGVIEKIARRIEGNQISALAQEIRLMKERI